MTNVANPASPEKSQQVDLEALDDIGHRVFSVNTAPVAPEYDLEAMDDIGHRVFSANTPPVVPEYDLEALDDIGHRIFVPAYNQGNEAFPEFEQ